MDSPHSVGESGWVPTERHQPGTHYSHAHLSSGQLEGDGTVRFSGFLRPQGRTRRLRFFPLPQTARNVAASAIGFRSPLHPRTVKLATGQGDVFQQACHATRRLSIPALLGNEGVQIGQARAASDRPDPESGSRTIDLVAPGRPVGFCWRFMTKVCPAGVEVLLEFPGHASCQLPRGLV